MSFSMMYSEEILKSVRYYGALQYPPEKVVSLLYDEAAVCDNDLSAFVNDLADPESPVHIMYKDGYNSESLTFEQIETLRAKLQYTDEKEYIDLRKNLFGV